MYPDDKEEWLRVNTDEIITKTHKNEISDFLERLQDIFGLGIKMGYGSVKLFFDFLVNKYTQYVLKAGDTMSGDLDMDDSFLKFKADKVKIKYQADHFGLRLLSSHDRVYISSDEAMYIGANTGVAGGGTWVPFIKFNADGSMWIMPDDAKEVRVGGNVLEGRADNVVDLGTNTVRFKEAHVIGDIEIYSTSKGIILHSATKKWRVNINDTGTLVTTQL